MNSRTSRVLLVVVLLAVVWAVVWWLSSFSSPQPVSVSPDEGHLPPAIVVPTTGPERDAAIAQIVSAGRSALKNVGMDTDAETIWLRAINEPAVPAADRQNLIEDLNEDGFANPKRLTLDAMPLVVTRLEMIERLLPQATDPVNIAAFKEAQKDLLKMQTDLARPEAPK